MDTEIEYYDDELDLREIVQTILQGWKTLLLLVVFMGAGALGFSLLQSPVYRANAVVMIDQSAYTMSLTPQVWLLSDAMRQAVADSLGLAPAELPLVTVTTDKSAPTVFVITVEAASATRAAQVANTWADVGLDYFFVQLGEGDPMQAARDLFADADQALVTYLQKNDLADVPWGELAWLTGVGTFVQSWHQDSIEFPVLTQQQRLDLAALMQARVAAERVFTEQAVDNIKFQHLTVVNAPTVLKKAIVPTSPESPNILQNTTLGALSGLILGIVWVFVIQWWQRAFNTE